MSKDENVPEKNKGGRPSDYSLELTDKICSRVSMGESLRSVCRDPAMPVPETVYRWFRLHEEFKDQYVLSKRDSADAHEDMIIDISDNPPGQPVFDENGNPLLDENGRAVLRLDNVAIQHAKLRVDSRKWAASKLKPKKYGEKLAIGGDESMAPIGVTRVLFDPDPTDS